MCRSRAPLAFRCGQSTPSVGAEFRFVAGIHAGDRPRHLTTETHGQLEALTRHILGVGVRTSHGDAQKD